MANDDVFDAFDEPFDQSRSSLEASDWIPPENLDKIQLQALVPSNWTNSRGESGTTWTRVGAAFRTEKGWRIVINANISVSGTIMLLPFLPPRD